MDPWSQVPEALRPGLRTHLDLLRRWNDRVDLVAPGDEATWLDAHVIDALLALDALPAGVRRVVDVGSGAGFPGLVWALCRPDLEVTLSEPRQRRAAFLRAVLRQTGASGVEVTSARSEALPRRGFDCAVSRATFLYARWLAEAAPLVTPAGWVLALLGRRDPEALGTAEAEAGLVALRTHTYSLPASGARRRVIVLRRADPGRG